MYIDREHAPVQYRLMERRIIAKSQILSKPVYDTVTFVLIFTHYSGPF
jgi:hypothetical protein